MANGRDIGKSKTTDPRGGHVRLYWEMLDSNAWRCLSATDQRAYIALQRQLRSTNNGDLSLPLTVARHSGITSKTTLAKSLRALVAVGLLAVTRKGGCTKGGQRLPTLYRLTDHQAYENPMKNIEASKPTNEWRAVRSIAMGVALIRDTEKSATEIATSKKNSHVQILALTGSKNGLVVPITGSNNGPWTVSPSPNNGHGETLKTGENSKQINEFQKSAHSQESENHSPKNGLLSTVAIPTGEFGASGVPSVGCLVPRMPASLTLIGRVLHRVRPATLPAGYAVARSRLAK